MREGKAQATLTQNPRFSVRWPLPNGTRVISLYDTTQYRLPVATGTREENNNNKIQETARVSNATLVQRRKEHCATTTGPDTTTFNGMEAIPYS